MFGRRALAGGTHITFRLPLSPLRYRALTNAAPNHTTRPRRLQPEQVPHNDSPSQLFCREVKTLHTLVLQDRSSVRVAISQFKKNTAALPRGSLIEDASKPLLCEVIAALLRSTNHQHRTFLRNLLRTVAELEAVDIAGYVATTLDHLIQSEDAITAMNFLLVVCKMEELQAIDVLSSLWHRLLERAAERRDEYIIPFVLDNMKKQGVRLGSRSVKVIMSALFRGPSPRSSTPPSYATIKHICHLLAPATLPYDPEVVAIIVDGYTRAGREDLAILAETVYTLTASNLPIDDCAKHMHELISALVAADHRDVAVRLAQRLVENGLQPSDETLLAAMGTDLTPRNLSEWRKILGYRGGAGPSAKVLAHLIDAAQWTRVAPFYSREFQDGIHSSEMLHLLLKAYLSSTIRPPSDSVINKALTFYHDYVSRCRSSPPESDTAQTTSDEDTAPVRLEPPKSKTYLLLLRFLTKSEHPAQSLRTAVSLVEDMHEFGVRMSSQSTASILVLLMRSSPTPVEAFNMYRLIGTPANPDDPPVLDEEAYAAVLHTFCELKNWPNGIPSVRQYFKIVADMRRQGIPVTSKIYTIIIRQLADLATAASALSDRGDDSDNATAIAVRESIAKTLKHVHNQLTVNTEFTPDTPLWNQLMDAYQRAGCFAEALRIWHKQFALGQITHTSVSIIIDACAFHKAYDVAVRIFTTLSDIGFSMNIRNWNTFLECLCRLDKLDEAMKVLCLEMNGRDDGIAPDEDSVRILMKFAAMKNQEMEVRSRVKRFLPKLYWSLPEDLR